MRLRSVGIDVGFSGAIALVAPDACHVWNMPVVYTEGKLKYIDGLALRDILVECNPDIIIIEHVGSRPGQGVASTFAFGVSFGGVLSTALSTLCPLELVVPSKWKRRYHLIGQSKEGSRQRAIRMFPHMGEALRRKKDDGKAEALLLADYGLKFAS